MNSPLKHESGKRRPVNLTIRDDVMKEAKSLNINASKAAEKGILEAIRIAREEEWIQNNKLAMQAHNTRIEKSGPLLPPEWAEE